MVRLRRGWYGLTELDADGRTTVRAGGMLGCVTGCRRHGLWMPPHETLHMVVPKHAGRVVVPPAARVHWVGAAGSGSLLEPVDRCLGQAIACVRPELAFAVVESAVRRFGRTEWMSNMIESAPIGQRERLREASGASESGTESVAAFRMRAAGIVFRQQVRISGLGRVDFLVGERLILEVDSNEFHDQPSHRLADLRRDAHSTVLGLRTLRLDYQQVLFDWPFCEFAIRAALGHRPSRVAIGG